MNRPYDALLLVSFGGPEGRADVIPFLENVLQGKDVPRERMLAVAEHYYHFGGVSPINQQNRELLAALKVEFTQHQLPLPLYWGNRNWHPFLADAMRQMRADGVQRALAFVTSTFGSYSGCRQYLEDIERARRQIGDAAPAVDKLRCPFNHPGFIAATADRVRDALQRVPPEQRTAARLVFTAHSIPVSMAQSSPYESQLQEACRLVGDALQHPDWTLVYQSRSGPPGQAWLEPDVCDYLRGLRSDAEIRAAVLVPIGFLSDHMEVIYDLDTVAQRECDSIGLPLVRAATVGTHPAFVAAIRDLVEERMASRTIRLTTGTMPPAPDECSRECCQPPRRRPAFAE